MCGCVLRCIVVPKQGFPALQGSGVSCHGCSAAMASMASNERCNADETLPKVIQKRKPRPTRPEFPHRCNAQFHRA